MKFPRLTAWLIWAKWGGAEHRSASINCDRRYCRPLSDELKIEISPPTSITRPLASTPALSRIVLDRDDDISPRRLVSRRSTYWFKAVTKVGGTRLVTVEPAHRKAVRRNVCARW